MKTVLQGNVLQVQEPHKGAWYSLVRLVCDKRDVRKGLVAEENSWLLGVCTLMPWEVGVVEFQAFSGVFWPSNHRRD